MLLEHQDRQRWDADLIERAAIRLRAAVRQGRPGPYQLQAGIAALHALAPSYAADALGRGAGTLRPAVRARPVPDRAAQPSGGDLVRASARQPALAEVDALRDRLDGYRLWHAVRADLLAALDRPADALTAAERALELATNPAERELMARRVGDLGRLAR